MDMIIGIIVFIIMLTTVITAFRFIVGTINMKQVLLFYTIVFAIEFAILVYDKMLNGITAVMMSLSYIMIFVMIGVWIVLGEDFYRGKELYDETRKIEKKKKKKKERKEQEKIVRQNLKKYDTETLPQHDSEW